MPPFQDSSWILKPGQTLLQNMPWCVSRSRQEALRTTAKERAGCGAALCSKAGMLKDLSCVPQKTTQKGTSIQDCI